MTTIRKAIRSALQRSWVGALEYHLNPKRLDGFGGGAFNGQCFRQLIFVDLVRTCQFEAIAETGTFVGGTTLFIAHNCKVPIYSCEINHRSFQIAKRRLKPYPNIHLTNGDSLKFLSTLPVNADSRAFFYLDAHWLTHLPLAEETEIIFNSFKNFVVMIDDFEVPGDSEYIFDDYGPGKKLSLRDFPYQNDPRVKIYFPRRPAREESGLRRGCIVLSSSNMESKTDSLDCLRRVGSTDLSRMFEDFPRVVLQGQND
jgi:hypothetical protein